MWCGQKFTYGHSCIRSQLYHILVEDTDKEEKEPEEFLDCVDNMDEMGQKEDADDHHSTISLHALLGTEGCQTMRIIGKIKKQSLVFLIDSGSTHNFVDQSAAKRLRCPMRPITKVQVTVANGDIFKS